MFLSFVLPLFSSLSHFFCFGSRLFLFFNTCFSVCGLFFWSWIKLTRFFLSPFFFYPFITYCFSSLIAILVLFCPLPLLIYLTCVRVPRWTMKSPFPLLKYSCIRLLKEEVLSIYPLLPITSPHTYTAVTTPPPALSLTGSFLYFKKTRIFCVNLQKKETSWTTENSLICLHFTRVIFGS